MGHLADPSQTWHVTCRHAAPTAAELQEAGRRVEHSGSSERAAWQRGRLESRRTVQRQMCVYLLLHTGTHTRLQTISKRAARAHSRSEGGAEDEGKQRDIFIGFHGVPECQRMPQVQRNLESSYTFGLFLNQFEISRVPMKRDPSIKANVLFFSCNVLE